jgi:hypothetical protein
VPAAVLATFASQPARAELSWTAPPECSHRPAALATESAAAAGEVQIRSVGPSEWTVTVLLFEPVAGLRRVTVHSCEEAAETAALLVRLATLAPVALGPEPAGEVAGSGEGGAQPRLWRFSLGVGGALDVGLFPVVEPRIAAAFSAKRGSVRLALDARAGLLDRVSPAARAQRPVEIQGVACFELERGRWSGAACAAVAGGAWRLLTDGGRQAFTALVSVGPQLRGAVRLFGGLELAGVIGLRANLRRPEPFTADGVLFTTGLVSGDLQLTLGWTW